MIEIRLVEFMQGCVAEVEARFGIRFQLNPELDNQKELVEPERYAKAVHAIRKYAPEPVGVLCAAYAEAEITPKNFVDLLAHCAIVGQADKTHLASCHATAEMVRRMMVAFFCILDGQNPEEVMPNTLAPGSKAVMDEVLLELEHLPLAMDAVQGLPPEQGMFITQTAFHVIHRLPERPDLERIKNILRLTRDYILACDAK